MGEEKLDPIELQVEAETEVTVLSIKQLMNKFQAYKHQVAGKVTCKIPTVAEINVPTGATESDLERKMRQLQVSDVNKHN